MWGQRPGQARRPLSCPNNRMLSKITRPKSDAKFDANKPKNDARCHNCPLATTAPPGHRRDRRFTARRGQDERSYRKIFTIASRLRRHGIMTIILNTPHDYVKNRPACDENAATSPKCDKVVILFLVYFHCNSWLNVVNYAIPCRGVCYARLRVQNAT